MSSTVRHRRGSLSVMSGKWQFPVNTPKSSNEKNSRISLGSASPVRRAISSCSTSHPNAAIAAHAIAAHAATLNIRMFPSIIPYAITNNTLFRLI